MDIKNSIKMTSFSHHSLILVTGATRSGKSEWAEKLATQTNLPVIYVATATIDPDDQQWQDRIQKHRQRRPSTWQTLEISHNLAQKIIELNNNYCLLIDSLGTYVANCLGENEQIWQQNQTQLLDSLKQCVNPIILVGEETGWGVIPPYESGRIFRDRLSHLIRLIGAIADPVYLVTGGHALNLKLLGEPLSVDN